MLRAATQGDVDQVVTVLFQSRLAFLPYAPLAHSETSVQDWIREDLIPTGRMFVWQSNQTIVGVLAASISGDSSWIDQLYVLPGWTNKGIGSKLLLHAHSMLPRPIRLYTFQANSSARRFYERHGYKSITFSDGSTNEEKCPDVLYLLSRDEAEA